MLTKKIGYDVSSVAGRGLLTGKGSSTSESAAMDASRSGWSTPEHKLCGRPPQYASVAVPLRVDLWPLDLESGVRVTCDVGYFCANFSLPSSLCSRLRPDVHDRQTSDAHHRLMPPTLGAGHNKSHAYTDDQITTYRTYGDKSIPIPSRPFKNLPVTAAIYRCQSWIYVTNRGGSKGGLVGRGPSEKSAPRIKFTPIF